MSSIIDGEVTYPRYPHGENLQRFHYEGTGQTGFMDGNLPTTLVIDEEFFIEDVEDYI